MHEQFKNFSTSSNFESKFKLGEKIATKIEKKIQSALDEEWKSQIYECHAEIGYFKLMKEAHDRIINQIPLEIREANQKEKKEN